jgi:hypothetical protein
VRRHGIGIVTIAVGAGSILLLLLGLSVFSPGPGDYVYTSGSLIAPFYILRVFPEVKVPFSSFVFPLCLALFALASARVSGATSLKELISCKSELFVEAVIVVTAIGALPAYLGIPQDSAAWYFLNVGQWYAMAALVARLSPGDFVELKNRVASLKLAGPVAVVTIFLLAVQLVQSLTPTFYKEYGEILRAADRQNGGNLLKGRNATQYLRETLAAERSLFGGDFRAALASSIGGRLVAQVRSAAGLVQTGFAVFVPPENEAFWKFQTDCRDKHNVQVSLTGLPSLLSAPPKEYGCSRDAYQTNYGARIDARAIGDAELCAHALERGIRRVLVLKDLYNSSGNHVLNCYP